MANLSQQPAQGSQMPQTNFPGMPPNMQSNMFPGAQLGHQSVGPASSTPNGPRQQWPQQMQQVQNGAPDPKNPFGSFQSRPGYFGAWPEHKLPRQNLWNKFCGSPRPGGGMRKSETHNGLMRWRNSGDPAGVYRRRGMFPQGYGSLRPPGQQQMPFGPPNPFAAAMTRNGNPYPDPMQMMPPGGLPGRPLRWFVQTGGMPPNRAQMMQQGGQPGLVMGPGGMHFDPAQMMQPNRGPGWTPSGFPYPFPRADGSSAQYGFPPMRPGAAGGPGFTPMFGHGVPGMRVGAAGFPGGNTLAQGGYPGMMGGAGGFPGGPPFAQGGVPGMMAGAGGFPGGFPSGGGGA